MVKGIVIYESRYGAARQYAEWIGERLNLIVKQSSQVGAHELAGYDFVIAGSSIYIGKLLIRTWLQKNEAILNQKTNLFFVVGAAPPEQIGKTEKYFTDNIPAGLLKSGNHFYLQGKSVYGELNLCDKFLLKTGAWLARRAGHKEAVLSDFNAIKPSNLYHLLNAAPQLFCQQVKESKTASCPVKPAA